MIIEIALGIVLAVLILIFLPELVAVSILALIGIVATVVVAGAFIFVWLGIQNPTQAAAAVAWIMGVTALLAINGNENKIITRFNEFDRSGDGIPKLVLAWMLTLIPEAIVWYTVLAFDLLDRNDRAELGVLSVIVVGLCLPASLHTLKWWSLRRLRRQSFKDEPGS